MKKVVFLVSIMLGMYLYFILSNKSSSSKLVSHEDLENDKALLEAQEKNKVTSAKIKKYFEKSASLSIKDKIKQATSDTMYKTQLNQDKIGSIQQLLNDIESIDTDAQTLTSILHEIKIKTSLVKGGHPLVGERYNVSNDGEDGLLINAKYNIMNDESQQFSSMSVNYTTPNKYEALRAYNQFLDNIPFDATLLKKTENILRWEHSNHLVTWFRLDKDAGESYNIKMVTEFVQCSHAENVAGHYDHLQ